MRLPSALHTVMTATLLGVPLGGMPASAQAQNNVPTLGREKLDPKTEKQIIEARKVIADMRARRASQEEVEQETVRLSKEIAGEEKGFMTLELAVGISLILGICLIAGRQIQKRDEERARQREANSGQPPEEK